MVRENCWSTLIPGCISPTKTQCIERQPTCMIRDRSDGTYHKVKADATIAINDMSIEDYQKSMESMSMTFSTLKKMQWQMLKQWAIY